MSEVKAGREQIVLLGFFVLLSAFILFFSPIVQLKFTHDTPVMLDGAWRIQNGHVPHVDFSSILGHAFLYQLYIFLRLFDYDVIAIVVSTIVFTATMVAIYLCFYKSKTFLDNSTSLLRVYIFLLILALGLGQYTLGHLVAALSYACIYNRYCFQGLVVIILILILLSGKKTTTKNGILLTIVLSLLLIYLLFSKLTFFIVAAAFILIFSGIKFFSVKYLKHLFLFSSIIFILTVVIFGQNFLSMLSDYKSISEVRSNTLTDTDYILNKFQGRYNLLFLLSIAFLLFEMIKNKASWKVVVLIVCVAIMGVGLHFTNYGDLDLVFFTFIPVFFILPAFIPYRRFWSFKIIMFCCCVFLFKNFRSIAFITYEHDYTEIKNANVKRFYNTHVIPKCNLDYALRQEDGLQLINRNLQAGEKIMSFTFESFFPLLTHTVPPKHNMLVWQDNMTYSESKYPEPGKLFSDVNLLLIPKCDEWEASEVMKKIYANAVNTMFVNIDESSNWTIYRKK